MPERRGIGRTIARYLLTYRQFQAFLEAPDGFANPTWWAGLAAAAGDKAAPAAQSFRFWNHPRDHVSWYDAVAFCRWLTAKAQSQPDLLPLALRTRHDWRMTCPPNGSGKRQHVGMLASAIRGGKSM
jgi:formylglycine-generating enzyme required for sulfatase activity